jgi:hypothetical protein
MEECVSEERQVDDVLCLARMALVNDKLDAIKSDGAETRAGVGKIIRKLTEGNGTEALVTTISRSDAYIKRLEEANVLDVIAAAKRLSEEIERKKNERRAMILWGVGIASGWALTLVKLFWP